MSKPHVIIIGADFTGVATAHDLALRGCNVTVVEGGDLCHGTWGRTPGLLHSGGRYAVKDKESAIDVSGIRISRFNASHTVWTFFATRIERS